MWYLSSLKLLRYVQLFIQYSGKRDEAVNDIVMVYVDRVIPMCIRTLMLARNVINHVIDYNSLWNTYLS